MVKYSLKSPIQYLKGVGEQRAEILRSEFNIDYFEDLIYYFPFRYIDKTKFDKIKDVNLDSNNVQIIGKIRDIHIVGIGRKQRMNAVFYDDTGAISLVWFQGVKWIKDSLNESLVFTVFGKPNFFNGQLTITHPEIEIFKKDVANQSGLYPVYNSSEKAKKAGINSKSIAKLVESALSSIDDIPESLSKELIEKLKLIPINEALKYAHFPQNNEVLKRALARLKFEELFFIQLRLLFSKLIAKRKRNNNICSVVGEILNTFYKNNLPFELTNAQKRVIKEIRGDLGSGFQMNRLLQGDVGSGKTLVALMSMLIALDNGFQACLMVPTEILSIQHYNSISNLINGLNINCALLTGSTKSAERKIIHKDLLDGNLNLLIGTHALIEDTVAFKNLGLVVVDEQHRFGVEQRAKMSKKNTNPPHILVMTATPIPRTLAMTVYGDLDVSVIDELPPGRKEIKTVHRFEKNRLGVFGFMRDQIKEGRQIYIVYPLIDESETLDLKNLNEGYEAILRQFPLPTYKVSVVHGKMKSADKDYEMQRFKKGDTNIMIATTVIEVGVDVPNATVMVIENAERFGLSQLHQLRGRVGRGGNQSYCILMSKDKISADAKIRLNAMVETNDGFKIADIDLEIRGPGDIYGTKQSGINEFKIANLSQDSIIIQTARKAAEYILDDDPDLIKEKNKPILLKLNEILSKSFDWSKIA